MRKFQKTLNIILAATLAVTSFPATTFAEESVKSSSESVSSASGSSILMNNADEAENTVTDKSDLSSARLLVGTDNASVVADDQDHILSSYDGLYLIQYPSEKAAKLAYDSYLETADFVNIDNACLSAASADTDITDVTKDHVMTEDSNPLTELADAPSGTVKKGTIALIDTGASQGGNVTEAVSMLGDNASDDNGHGTRMAGYITEENPDAEILSIKALDANGNGTPSSVTAAIKYAMERKVSVINLSLSGTKTAETSAVEKAVKEAVQAGIVVIGAAGNNGKNAKYYIPGGIDEAVIVGAADAEGKKIKDTNYGDTVDYYVAAASTSEAAARLSGICSKEGKITADNKTVFTTVAADNSETDEDNTDSTSDDIQTANGGSGSSGATGGGAIGNVHGFFVWHDSGKNTSVDVSNDNAINSNITNFRTQQIEHHAISGALSSVNDGDVTDYRTLYKTAAQAALKDAAKRSKTKKARVVGAIGIYTIGLDGSTAFPVYGYSESSWEKLTNMRADNGSGLPDSISWNSVHYNNGEATNQNWRQWLYEYGLQKVRSSAATFYGTTVIVYAVADDEPTVQNGYVRIHKSSSDPGATNGNSNYSFSGGFYGIWKNAACTQGTGKSFTLNANGYSNTVELPAGTYYIREITAPKGYEYSGTVYPLKVTAGSSTNQPLTLNVTDTPKYGYIRIHKSSSNPEITNGNPCYSFKGGWYGIWKNAACTQGTGKSFTLDENGYSNTLQMPIGTYYIKEITAPKGYNLSSTVYPGTVTEESTASVPVLVGVTDLPGTDPIGITINKNTPNAAANIPSLEGTEFTVKYYNNYYTSQAELPAKATRTWVFAAKWRQNIQKYRVLFDNTYKVGGDALYTVTDSSGTHTVVPYGTITIQETKAAGGYDNNASFTGSDGTSYGSVVLARVDDSGKLVSVKTGNSLSDTSLDVNDTLIPVPFTSLRDEEGSQYTEAKKEVKLTDTVSIKNLNSYIGKTITISGTLYDKQSGQPLTINGKTVTASTTLNVTSETGEVKNVFTFDATGMTGKTVVATESILVDGKEAASHKDLNDTEQMVFFPKISTILYQDVNGDKTSGDGEKIIAFDLDKNGKPVQTADDTKAFDTNVTLTDQVIYENLAPSKVYEVTGKLMKVNADGSLTDTGILSKETSFISGAATSGNLTASGSVDIHYSFDAMQYQNCQLAAFETLNLSGKAASAREEENIEAQRIRILVATPKKVVSKVSNNRYEIHTWSITTKIPSGMEDSRPEQRGASFTDAIDSRLDYKGNVRVDVIDSQETNANVLLTLGNEDYTVSGATEGTAGGTLKVVLTTSGLEKISKKQYEGIGYLRLRFDTLINQTAVITPEDGADIPNTVEIRWDDLGKVLVMHGNDHVASGSVRIMKIDNNHQSLAGAKFVLLNEDKSRYQQNDSTGANPKDYPEQVSGTDGYVQWSGLEDGTYYIRETAAPPEKALQSDDIKVVLKDHKVVSVNDTKVINPVFRVADSGKLVLQTGGPGRAILTVLSIAVIALAVCALLVVMKRQRKMENRK